MTAVSVYANGNADTTRIKQHLTVLTKTDGYRNADNVMLLNKTADYIYNHFAQFADTVYYQEYAVGRETYKNVVCILGADHPKTIVVGAHYDVCGNQQGADDNASGVAGLLKLSQLLKEQKLNHRVELVAYTLEEPPYFRTEHMGSYIHAASLANSKTEVYGMLSLEMIGYFKDQKHSQSYPIGALALVYGKRGDYITLVNKVGAGKFAKRFSREFKETKAIKTKKFVGPKALPGIDFSDHLNYWKFGFSALMLTDTAFYRNKNYHQPIDTIETLDIKRMAKVIDGVVGALTGIK
ncbi:M28 family peptidase [Pontibacter harenae]|uniref:M28 family peptidase n=1 Tax=Pontibacter harenae TaxID=2894083 RepID=UPI001E304B1A|nr:M28 family peptidase [Pontibacter harenae]MCC9166641.1 M28 family peptidase [Pontibacter harenae]